MNVLSGPAGFDLTAPRGDDLDWVIARHAALYAEEYGWGAEIESVTAGICRGFAAAHDPAREACWIARRGPARLGSVFLVQEPGAADVARLRLLLVEPEARGLGLGRTLVETCIVFARDAGYREIVLWTHAVLTRARAVYADVGFVCEATWTHDDFGKPEVSETWRLRL